MPRIRSTERLEQVLEAASRVFMKRGYRRARMADVADVLGVTEPALYRYVESKDALFDRVIRRAATPDTPEPPPESLPLRTPAPGTTLEFLRQALERRSRLEALEAAPAEIGVAEAAAELETILRQLFAATARHRVGLKIVERSAADWPDLAAHWFGRIRGDLIERLGHYLARRRDQGALWAMPDARTSARLIVETIAFFAMHRHHDPFGPAMDDRTAEETAVRTLCNAHTPSSDHFLPHAGTAAGERP